MDGNWFYNAMEIADILVRGDYPASVQFLFLEHLLVSETLFFPEKWRLGNKGKRAMFFDVQTAMAYLADQESLDDERNRVEEDGGTLPTALSSTPILTFFKGLRLDMALRECLGEDCSKPPRMKCKTLLKLCGTCRRNNHFCWDFADAAAFYHIGLKSRKMPDIIFSITSFRHDEYIFMVRL